MDKTESPLVTIVIPVYKSVPDAFELFAIKRCFEILGNYAFTIVTHAELDLKYFIEVFKKHNIKFQVSFFDKNYFQDTDGYNKLMVDPNFYKKFINYKYILIYQLDAFVFSDQLLQWCDKGYDYIGAPWLNVNWVNRKAIEDKLPFIARFPWLFKLFMGKDGMVGNGGFSLRKVDSHIKYAETYSKDFDSLHFNEDIFWGKYVAAIEKDFKIPLLIEAIAFSIESDPAKGLRLLNDELPFGCHAWYKNEITFWIKVFHKNGINITALKT